MALPPERPLILPPGVSLDQLLCDYPDEPLPSVAGFDRLYQSEDVDQIRRLNELAESQQFVSIVLKHHGEAGLAIVLKGIAKASSHLGMHMQPRIAAIAAYNNWPVV